MEDVGIFCGHLDFLRPFGILRCNLVYFMVIWYIFHPFGMLHREKSGNPGWFETFCFSRSPFNSRMNAGDSVTRNVFEERSKCDENHPIFNPTYVVVFVYTNFFKSVKI
jgi:hypothetical protein